MMPNKQSIPRVMSTQHPDNVFLPFFSHESVMSGEDEVKEAYYAFSHLGAQEQLWDVEGKEIDNYVVVKLLSKYPEYFKHYQLGKEKFLTFRIPNPDVEALDAKIVGEVLFSIPRNYDIAQAFYGKLETAPIFEVVLPMTTSARQLRLIKQYYEQCIVRASRIDLLEDGKHVKDWLGQFLPPTITVTPLFETKEAILHADRIVEQFVRSEKITDQMRVWFARSDPAMNYGSAAAVLLVKLGLWKLWKKQQELHLPLYPIIGCGSAPFRGNFKPTNVEHLLQGYPSVQTFTIQSSFKYDYPVERVQQAIEKITRATQKEPFPIPEKTAMAFITAIEKEYTAMLPQLAPLINTMSKFIPSRRKRKLHVGLFGYARSHAGIHLPRAIKFCATLYSVGIPPEILGLSWMKKDDLAKLKTMYPNVEKDMADALAYYNEQNLALLPSAAAKNIKKAASLFTYQINQEHKKLTTAIAKAYQEHDTTQLQDLVLKAASIRRFLG